MTILILLLLIAGSTTAIYFSRPWEAKVLSISAIFWTLFVGAGLLPSILVGHLQNLEIGTPVWKTRNALILLASGMMEAPGGKYRSVMPSRDLEAANYYFQCKRSQNICKIIVTGGDTLGVRVPEAFVIRNSLLAMNIPEEDILLETMSMNTFQNARFVEPIIRNEKFDAVFVISSGFHLKRALLYFEHFKLHPQPLVSDHLDLSLRKFQFSKNFFVADVAIHEFVGIARYYVYQMLGMNK